MRFHGAKQGCGTSPKKKLLEASGALLREDGDLLREYQAMHDENFVSSRLRENVEGKKKNRDNMNNLAKEEERKSGKQRRREKGHLFGSFV